MDPADAPAELLPCVDFTQTRRALRGLYVTCFFGAAAAIGALAVLQTDVVVVGSAVVTPLGETARVQTTRGGAVDAILVREGDGVEKGQTLLRLDGRPVHARLEMLMAQAQAVRGRAQLLERLVESRAVSYRVQGLISDVDRAGIDARRVAAQRMIEAREREREIRARDETTMQRLVTDKALAQKDMDSAAIRASEASAQAEAARAALNDVETTRLRLTLQRELLQRDSAVAGFSDGAELADARTELTRLEGEIASAQLERGQLEITAPRAGIVQGLAVLDRGDVVSPGSTLAYVVPGGDDLIVKASINSDGIAFVWPKQAVRMKLDAYPFQDFGVFHGQVRRVASDTTSLDPTGKRGAAYDVEVGITQAPHARQNEPLPLRPGMTGQAEFTVRREAMLAALLRPLRGATDSLRY